jgi:hypothetical protein
MRKVLKLLALLAVLLMPFGMAPVIAAPTQGNGTAMPMQDCPQPVSDHHSKGTFAECTMACSAALPAVELVREAMPLPASLPIGPTVAQALHGLHPDTATPPPKAP